jgi:hypothetical protein
MDKILLKPAGRMMANPLALALVITIVIMFIVRFSYDDEHMFRTAIRIFGATTLFLFINNHVLIKDINARQLNPDQQNIIYSLENSNIQSRPAEIMGGNINHNSSSGGEQDDEDDGPMIVRSTNQGSNILEQLPDASSIVRRV